MDRLSFGQLPLVVKIAVGMTFCTACVCIEEFVIDRHGLWKYMPYYKVGDPCLWDLGVTLVIVIGLWRVSGQKDRQSNSIKS